MFKLFRRKESEDAAIERVYVKTLETFLDLGITPLLLHMQNVCMEGQATNAECNDLVIGAYRTLFIAAGFARQELLSDGRGEGALDKVSAQLLNDSSLTHLVTGIREAVPRIETEPMLLAANENGYLFRAGSMMATLVHGKKPEQAFEVWRTAAKGDFHALKTLAKFLA